MPAKPHRQGANSLAKRFFITYLSLITVLTFGMAALFLGGARITKERELANVGAQLAGGASKLEDTVLDISWIFAQLKSSYDYISLATKSGPLEPRDYLVASQLQRSFSISVSGISIADYAFLRLGGLLYIDADRLYTSTQSFLGDYFAYPHMDAQDMMNLRQNALPTQPVYIRRAGAIGDYLTLLFRESAVSPADDNTIFLLIRADRLLDLLLRADMKEAGALRVVNLAGEELLLHNPHGLAFENTRGQNLIAQEVPLLGFTVEAVVPTSLYFSKTQEAMGLVLALAVCAVAVSLALAVLHAIRSSAPIHKIAAGVGGIVGDGTAENSFEYIYRSLSRIGLRQDELVADLNLYKIRLHDSLLDSLLDGYVPHDVKKLQAAGVHFPQSFRLLLLGRPGAGAQPEDDWRGNLQTLSMHSLASDALSGSVFVHDKDNRYTVAVIPFGVAPYAGDAEVGQRAGRLLAEVREKTGMQAVCVVSPPMGDAGMISREFARAKNLLAMVSAGETPVFLEPSDASYEDSLPITVLSQFYELLLMGAWGRLDDILASVFSPKALYSEHFCQNYYSIRGRVVDAAQRLSPELRAELAVPDYDARRSNRELAAGLTACVEQLCGLVNRSKISHNDQRISEILTYIQQNHGNPQLGIHMIAERFGMSPKYVSQFIKSLTGKTYTEFLEDFRLTRAADLLRETDKPVALIAEEVGFTSQNTFYKAFRRVYGVPPSGWRNAADAARPTL